MRGSVGAPCSHAAPDIAEQKHLDQQMWSYKLVAGACGTDRMQPRGHPCRSRGTRKTRGCLEEANKAPLWVHKGEGWHSTYPGSQIF